MDYIILGAIGVLAGLLGGLLGIGGSIIVIPALVFVYGENQHLYQASAMICNFFVGTASAIVHKNADTLVIDTLKWLIPVAAFGIIIGVAISNSSVFARQNSYILARIFGIYLIYAILYNCLRFFNSRGGKNSFAIANISRSIPLAILCGLLTGIPAGLLGIGAGTICIPAQQFFLKMPLKNAISNSAATIAVIALVGACHKNITLSQHSIAITDSLKIAMFVVPGAILGAFLGSQQLHKLSNNIVRGIFILIAALACYKLLTVTPGI
ncbi:MAG: sulfite exporter TauE/SafE family protein [Planctomycetes bacterium]|nr:sulfite exporter TauE/SafE family protein [Planctomycetota bacterium]